MEFPEKSESEKRHLTEQLWLQYFNQVLFERGIITEQNRNRMIHKIDGRAKK